MDGSEESFRASKAGLFCLSFTLCTRPTWYITARRWGGRFVDYKDSLALYEYR